MNPHIEVESRCRPEFTDRIISQALGGGADLAAVTSAEPFDDIRHIIEHRKSLGYARDMQFTYRNPARSTDVSQSLPDAQSLVVCAVSYAHTHEQQPKDPYARVAQYATSNAKEILNSALQHVSTFLRDAGWRTRIFSDDNSLVDRAAAMRAGIGFYGKNALIISRSHGSVILLGAVVTTAPLAMTAHKNLMESVDGCGTCTKCLPSCPTGAIVAPGVIDATNCLSWLAQSPENLSDEHARALGDRIYGCDECQDVCPYNKIQIRKTTEQSYYPSYHDLSFLLTCTDEQLLEAAGEWYVYQRDPQYLRRNALIIAGNTLPLDSDLWSIVADWSTDSRPVVSRYAHWALNERDARKM